MKKKRISHIRMFNNLKGKISFNVPMARHTTMRTGGPAFALYQPESLEALREAVILCNRLNISYLAIGAGSNIIVKNRGTNKLIIKLSSPYFKRIEVCGSDITCGAGVALRELNNKAESRSLAGSGFLIGIPGTIGGAVAQNAGSYGASISDIIKDVKVMDRKGVLRVLRRSEIDFGYRKSGLKKFIVLAATLCLKRSAKEKIRKAIGRNIAKRLATQDYTAPSAGCIFKNPAGSKMSAGEMIDRCGLKGFNMGGAFVSTRHANFIINKKNASAEDILRLIKAMKKKVYGKFSVRLEEEVEII